MSKVTYSVSLEIRDMDNEDLANPQIIEFCKILEESPESVLLGGWDIGLGSFEVDAETSVRYWDDNDYFSLTLEQDGCSSPTERLLLEWLLKNNHCRKPLIYNLILEKEP